MLNAVRLCFRSAVAVGFVLSMSPHSVRAETTFDRPSTLGTPDQIELERTLTTVLQSAEVVHQRRIAYESIIQDPLASDPDGRATLMRALDGITTAMAQCGVNGDSDRPQAMWNSGAAHSWFGLDIPASGYGIENPDNVYRTIPMDGASSYEITGQIREPGPSQLSFTLYASRPDIHAIPPIPQEGSGLIGALSDVETGPDGRFVVSVDPRPASGRANHLQSGEPTALLVVRDTLGDWRNQRVVPLQVRRVGGPEPKPAPDIRQRIARTVACMKEQIPLWMLHYNQKYIFSQPPNQIQSPRVRTVGWGLSRSAHFDLSDDEALVVTLDPIGARYLGFQLADPWGMSLEYVERTGSLNHTQARPNSDGSFTYVISREDPGVHNWLDTSGLRKGILAIRWQGFSEPIHSAESAVREVKLVKREKLPSVLPREATYVTPAERKEQIEVRVRSYERRLRE